MPVIHLTPVLATQTLNLVSSDGTKMRSLTYEDTQILMNSVVSMHPITYPS